MNLDQVLDNSTISAINMTSSHECRFLRATGPCSCSIKDKLRCPEPLLRACIHLLDRQRNLHADDIIEKLDEGTDHES